MKKRKNIKIIFNVFLSFILIFLFFCGDLQVFAENTSVTVTQHTGYSSFYSLRLLAPLNSNTGLVSAFGEAQTVDVSPDTVYYFRVVYRRISGGSAYYQNYKVYFNGSLLSTDVNNPTVIDFASSLTFNVDSSYTSDSSTSYYVTFVNFVTPTPEPTPTPTPAPTPTPLPVDYDDTHFWGRMNDMAEGGWSAITATFNGIFNNTVFRNLVVYVPLFGAIIYLFVYLLFMGSD